MSTFATAQRIADAVLYEGYALYPYRASAAKNRIRFQWGVLVPPSYLAADPSERSGSQTECLVEKAPGSSLQLRIRFLHLSRRDLEVWESDEWHEVEALDLGDELLQRWDDSEEVSLDLDLEFDDLATTSLLRTFELEGDRSTEQVITSEGSDGRVTRTKRPLLLRVSVAASPLEGPYKVHRLSVSIENMTETPSVPESRDEALRASLIGCHVLIGLDGAAFISQIDPPEWAGPYVSRCVNEGTYPVLIGEPGTRNLMLSSPIILYDYPEIAPESPDDLFDATEIDELLYLRTMTLTDREKREARGTDPRTAAIIEQADHLPPEMLERLHGAIRQVGTAPRVEPEETLPWWDPGNDDSVSPETDTVDIGGISVSRGTRVRLLPRIQSADAQDMFLEGREATVEAVIHDVDGGIHLAVSVNDDPASEMMHMHGRYLYFSTDEVEPVEPAR